MSKLPDPDISYYVAEVERLKVKCNAQVDFINKIKAGTGFQTITKGNPFMMVFEVFYYSINEALRNDLFFEMKRDTPASRKYHIVEAKGFRAIIKKYAPEAGTKKMLETWFNFGLVEKFSNERFDGNYSYCSRSIRVIRVSKEAVNLVREAAARGEI